MDLNPAMEMLMGLVERLAPMDAHRLLPPSGELAVWAVTAKPALHLLLGTAMYRNASGQRSWSDVMPNPNIMVYGDPKWCRRNKPVLYGVVRSPAQGGGVAYNVIDPVCAVQPYLVNSPAARVGVFVDLATVMPIKADTWRTMVGT